MMHTMLRSAATVVALVVTIAPAHALLPIQTWTLDNGARVLFVENRALPMIDVSIDFPAGYGRDTRERSGLASMTLSLMRLGAGGLGEAEVSGALADVGAQLGSRFDADRAGYSVRTLSSAAEREPAIDILARVVQQPLFSADVLGRETRRLVAGLQDAATKPESIADRALSLAVFGDHPYGLRGSGEVDTITTLTAEDLAAFHRRWYRSDYSVIAIIGDLSRDAADSIARRLTAGLPRGADAPPPLAAVKSLDAPVVHRIAHPASQSHILLGAPGMKRDDPDYFPLFVGNYVLGGGGFVSRIVEEVRQKRGLAYSSYSYFVPMSERGQFQVGLQTRREQADEALEVTRATLERFVAEGPTDDELVAAKQNLVGGFPLRIDSNRKIHDYLATIGFYRLPIDYLDQFVDRIESVTVAQIKDAFQRRVDPDRMVTVVVAGGAREQ